MKFVPVATSLLAVVMLAVTPALALTVINQNKSEQTLTVDRGQAQADQKMAAGASAEVECNEGCELRVRGSGYGRAAEAGDKLIIDDEGMIPFTSEDIVTGSVKPPTKTKQ
ncbi:conserved exported protein of unknown function [Methylorubrum extorquens]|uniref:DUF5666 domain-containing protein n=1 Tax=Methylorubrum extorquens TaxID=408 RepID=A0A2N9AYW4_METEX|nr:MULTISPECIES: hypothetical protein [Methylobacteriaceae]KQQ01175.1 hypothetical protein ASF59_03070 [Methylobacterium sp. Leaf121]KQQ11520.1 hypothetical protein ASF56_24810 [Methylobacterium sp. Leaf122]WHQ70521.1 hypothetical protein KEC54_02480 [Methylorubrum extorquens]SOR32503.1 conserved exported protein of unknown function [Methylorubrum extorquens]